MSFSGSFLLTGSLSVLWVLTVNLYFPMTALEGELIDSLMRLPFCSTTLASQRRSCSSSTSGMMMCVPFDTSGSGPLKEKVQRVCVEGDGHVSFFLGLQSAIQTTAPFIWSTNNSRNVCTFGNLFIIEQTQPSRSESGAWRSLIHFFKQTWISELVLTRMCEIVAKILELLQQPEFNET